MEARGGGCGGVRGCLGCVGVSGDYAEGLVDILDQVHSLRI